MRKKPVRLVASCLLGILALLAVWTLFIEPRRLVVHREEIELPGWPKGTPALKVALLSDLHVGSPHWGVSRLRALVEKTNAENADVVVLAGDYVIDRVLFGTKVDQETIGAELGNLRAPFGVVAVLGNHDWWNGGERMRRALEAHGIVVLENDVRTFVRDGKPIAIAGLADAVTREPEPELTFEKAPPESALVAVVHEPDIFPSLGNRPAITLAGHTHGGQVRFPFIGSPVVPSDFGQRFVLGHIVEHGKHLFVTTGIGTSILPVRFGVPPEIAILTLRSR